jgi:hypothetical protein
VDNKVLCGSRVTPLGKPATSSTSPPPSAPCRTLPRTYAGYLRPDHTSKAYMGHVPLALRPMVRAAVPSPPPPSPPSCHLRTRTTFAPPSHHLRTTFAPPQRATPAPPRRQPRATPASPYAPPTHTSPAAQDGQAPPTARVPCCDPDEQVPQAAPHPHLGRTHARTHAPTHARTHTRTHARTHPRTHALSPPRRARKPLVFPCVAAPRPDGPAPPATPAHPQQHDPGRPVRLVERGGRAPGAGCDLL